MENLSLSDATSHITTKNVFKTMLFWQSGATMVVALLAFFIAGKFASISVLLGGFSVVVGTLVAAIIALRVKNSSDASGALANFLLAEIVKIVVLSILLFLSFKLYKQLIPVALIAGLMVSALLSGAAISKIYKKTNN